MLNFKSFLLATSLFLSLSAVLAQGSGGGRIRYVATDGSASAAGASWATATTLQSALDNYMTQDTLFVKKGSYTPTKTRGDGMPTTDPRDATYLLPDGIAIYGGFAGTETSLVDRDMNLIATTNESIIEGNIGNMNSKRDNVWRLLTLPANRMATLDGLTVARGYAYILGRGSGLHAGRGSQLTLQHCRFIDHTASLRGSLGGAIYTKGTLRVMNSTFEGNSAPIGGGGAICANPGMVTVINSTFKRNSALDGAAIIVSSGTLTVTNSTFKRNSGGTILARGMVAIVNSTFERNSGVAIYSGETLTVTNCIFKRNLDAGTGTIYVEDNSMLTITNSTFEENSTIKGRSGAIYVRSGTLRVTNSTFERNSTINGSSGAIYVEDNSMLIITNSTFEENSVALGGGGTIFMNEEGTLRVTGSTFKRNLGCAILARGELSVINSTFEENSVALGGGGAIWADGTQCEIMGCLFVGNVAEGGAAFYAYATRGSFINNTVYGNRNSSSYYLGTITLLDNITPWVVANNIIYGNHSRYELYLWSGSLMMSNNLIGRSGMEGAEGTIISMHNPITPPDDASLLFASLDSEAANYLRLLPESVGVDAGSNNYIDGNADVFEIADTMGVRDLGGSKRIVNNEVDLGAYEFLGIEVATTPASLTYLPSSEGNITATITLSGFATRWVARAGEGAVGVLTLPSVLTGVSGDRFSFNYAQNTTPEDREAKVVLEAQGSMGESSTYTLTLLQAGRGRHILRVRTNPVRLVSLSAAGGDVEASIIHGGDATGWEVVETDDASNFVTLPATTSGMGRGSLTFSYAPQVGAARQRQAQVEVRTTGTGEIRKYALTLIQQGTLLSVDNATDEPLTDKTLSRIVVINPARDYLRLRGLEVEVTMHLFTLSGRLVMSKDLEKGDHAIPLSGIKPGAYLLALMGEYGNNRRMVLLKE